MIRSGLERLRDGLGGLVSADRSAQWLVLWLLAFYFIAPLVTHLFFLEHPTYPLLAAVTLVACGCIGLGFRLPLADRRFRSGTTWLAVDERLFHGLLWGGFGIVALVTLVTAPSLPLWSALRGAELAELDRQRADFLKLREGWEAVLPYVNSIFLRALAPLGLALLFFRRSRGRYLAFAGLLFFVESFLVKLLFVVIAAPLLYVFAQRRRLASALGLVVFSAGLLYFNTIIARIGAAPPPAEAESETAPPEPAPAEVETPQPAPPALTDVERFQQSLDGRFMGSRYRASGRIDYLVWRAFAVPVFTAADALLVFEERYDGEHFLGATSSILARLTGRERIPFEAEVFAFQWNPSPYGRSNSFYATEAYANFGWPGVVLFSLVIGQALRVYRLSSEEAFRAMWLLFAFFVSQGGLIGTLLSNGHSLLLVLALVVTIRPAGTERAGRALLSRHRRG